MTIPHVGPPVGAESIEDAEAHLRDRGMRGSTARRRLGPTAAFPKPPTMRSPSLEWPWG